MFTKSLVVALAASLAAASPCPFGEMAERGELSEEQTAQFYKVRAEKEAGVEVIMLDKQKRDFEHQASAYEHMQKRGLLPLGGGLLNGQLQPFTGALSNLSVPTLQPVGLAIVPDAEHPYVAPLPTDVRGMCPTLNTMANHGYISHDGITTFAQAADACQITLGFGYDTCVFLSALALLAGGDLPTGIYSIGGADSRVPNTIGPALGASKHGFFEIDDSITREDTYFGNQANFNLSRWERWNAIAQSNGNSFGLTTMNQERQISFTESQTQNPEFNSDAKALAVALAERVFIPRALPNGTDESQADFRNIGAFYLNETFPMNWFRRGSSYDLSDVGVDIVDLYAMGPTPLGINDGYDNFIPDDFDFAALTPAEATCFLLTSALDFIPGQLTPAFVDATDVYMAFAYGAIATLGTANSCGTISYTAPGPDAGSSTPGVSTSQNILTNGVYS